MKQLFLKVMNITAVLTLLTLAGSSMVGSSIVSAAQAPDASSSTPNKVCGQDTSTSKGQVLAGASETGTDCTGSGVTNIVQTVVSILSYIIGAAAVVMVILAGLKYVTSGGDSSKVSSAKSSLVYALVGLAVAALAQVLVHFVLDASTKAANGKTGYTSPTTSQLYRA